MLEHEKRIDEAFPNQYGGRHFKTLSIKAAIDIIRKSSQDFTHKFGDEQKLYDHVQQVLDKRSEEVIAKLLGFKVHKDGWDRDWSSRENTVLSKLTDELATKACTKWIDGELQKMVDRIKPTKSFLKALQEEFRNRYRRRLEDEVKRVAEQQAVEDVQTIFNTIGYNPEDFTTIVNEALKSDSVKAKLSKDNFSFETTGVLSDCVPLGIVNIDEKGTLIGEIHDSKVNVWLLANVYSDKFELSSTISLAMTIVTNGTEWYPVKPTINHLNFNISALSSGMYHTHSNLRYGSEQIFKFMNEHDFELLKRKFAESISAETK